VTLSGAATGTLTGTGAGNRVSLTFTPTAGTLTLTVSGSVTSAMLEAGSFPTSYIPTTTAQVTRSSEVAKVTQLAPWHNVAEGTLYAEFSYELNARPGTVASFDDGTASNRIFIAGFSSNQRLNGAVTKDGNNVSTIVLNDGVTWSGKVAFGIQQADMAAAFNGVMGSSTNYVGALPPVSQLSIGGGNTAAVSRVNGHIRSIRYWPRRLSNAELQGITA
ncbi:hypothetical protein ACNFCJ_07975, partial [Pseudomonas sp. NY15364]|uniref:hypothetical protein n=1 Tax=Pseudomonas sp. NY15364 TaxID=3400353 RepID=UPI003A8672D3